MEQLEDLVKQHQARLDQVMESIQAVLIKPDTGKDVADSLIEGVLKELEIQEKRKGSLLFFGIPNDGTDPSDMTYCEDICSAILNRKSKISWTKRIDNLIVLQQRALLVKFADPSEAQEILHIATSDGGVIAKLRERGHGVSKYLTVCQIMALKRECTSRNEELAMKGSNDEWFLRNGMLYKKISR